MLRIKSGTLAPTLAFSSRAQSASPSPWARAPRAEGVHSDEAASSTRGRVNEGGPLAEAAARAVRRAACGQRIPCVPFCRSDQKCVSKRALRLHRHEVNATTRHHGGGNPLGASGSDVTICLGAIQAASVSVSSTATTPRPSHHRGGPILTTPRQVSISPASGSQARRLRDVATVTVSGATKVTMRGLKLSTAGSYAVQISPARRESTGRNRRLRHRRDDDQHLVPRLRERLGDVAARRLESGTRTSTAATTASTSAARRTRRPSLRRHNTIDKGRTASTSPRRRPLRSTRQHSSRTARPSASTSRRHAAVTTATMRCSATSRLLGRRGRGAAYVKTEAARMQGVPQTKPGSPCRGVASRGAAHRLLERVARHEDRSRRPSGP